MHLAGATRLYLQVVLRDDAHWDHFARMVDRGEIGRRGERLGEGGRGGIRFCQISLICSVCLNVFIIQRLRKFIFCGENEIRNCFVRRENLATAVFVHLSFAW